MAYGEQLSEQVVKNADVPEVRRLTEGNPICMKVVGLHNEIQCGKGEEFPLVSVYIVSL